MNIQSNINNMLSLAGLLSTQTSAAKFRKEGEGIQATQEQAIRGLKDIEGNLERVKRGEKSYNEEELKNIEERTNQYQKDIYDAKSAYLNPKYQRYINPDAIKQPDLSSKLSNISNEIKNIRENDRNMYKIQMNKDKANESINAKAAEQEASKNFAKMFTEGVYIKGDKGGLNG